MDSKIDALFFAKPCHRDGIEKPYWCGHACRRRSGNIFTELCRYIRGSPVTDRKELTDKWIYCRSAVAAMPPALSCE